jgi:hypothetical protein
MVSQLKKRVIYFYKTYHKCDASKPKISWSYDNLIDKPKNAFDDDDFLKKVFDEISNNGIITELILTKTCDRIERNSLVKSFRNMRYTN